MAEAQHGPAAGVPRPRVVIVGAGFGGLFCARGLAKAPVEVLLIDRTNHNLFQPLLYQVATAALAPSDIAVPIRSLFRGNDNVAIRMDEVVGVDWQAHMVRTRDAGALPYDVLVLATGSVYSWFGHDEWAPYSHALKTLDQALALRGSLLAAFELAESRTDPAEVARLMTFVIVGGGPTGVELAGALAELAHSTLKRDFTHIRPSATRIVLCEAGPTHPRRLSETAHRLRHPGAGAARRRDPHRHARPERGPRRRGGGRRTHCGRERAVVRRHGRDAGGRVARSAARQGRLHPSRAGLFGAGPA